MTPLPEQTFTSKVAALLRLGGAEGGQTEPLARVDLVVRLAPDSALVAVECVTKTTALTDKLSALQALHAQGKIERAMLVTDQSASDASPTLPGWCSITSLDALLRAIEPLTARFLAALSNKAYLFRTIQGIASEANLTVAQVADLFLVHEDSIVRADRRATNGAALYALRSRFENEGSTLGKFLGAFTNRVT